MIIIVTMAQLINHDHNHKVPGLGEQLEKIQSELSLCEKVQKPTCSMMRKKSEFINIKFQGSGRVP